MKKAVIIDGQGGRIGAALINTIRQRGLGVTITAIGTNSIATANMMKSNPDNGATGENPVIVACKNADIIAGPIGIAVADSLLGEVTPKMAKAVGQSGALRVLIPVNKCDTVVVGASELSMGELIEKAVDLIEEKI